MEEIHELCIKKVSTISDSNGSAYYDKSSLKVGIITDEFMYNYYKDALDIEYLSPINYKQLIDENKYDMVLYVSCWLGMGSYDGTDEHVSMHYNGDAGIRKAEEVLGYARSKSIPVVFQTIEDPPSYERFLPLAKCADYIFTSAVEKIDDYRRDAKNENVYPLPYGVNPAFHNPICTFSHLLEKDLEKMRNAFFFAGSWYENFQRRCEDTKLLFDGVIKSKTGKLCIADRNFDRPFVYVNKFPDEYTSAIMPAFGHDTLQKVHKLFGFSVNLNSITDSESMCAMRVYELQALGCLVVTNYALSVSALFPGLFTIFSEKEVDRILEGYTRQELINMRIEGIREQFTNCTVYDRLNYIFDTMGMDRAFPSKKVLVICDKITQSMKECIRAQSYSDIALVEWEDVDSIDDHASMFVIYLYDKKYPKDYVLDLVNAFKFVDVDYVKYASHDDYARAYNYASGTATQHDCLFKGEHLRNVIVNEQLEHLSGFEVIPERKGRTINLGTKELAVIVPIYNNGKYLKKRCFKSLLRSSIFEKMKVYLIDGGSTNEETLEIINELTDSYSNVDAYFFDDCQSDGTARSCNKGLEISNEPFVTFISPTNEVINNGYAVLYERMVENDVDFVAGSILCVSKSGLKEVKNVPKDGRVEDLVAEMIVSEFSPLNNQAMILKRKVLSDNHLSFVENGLGEDGFFSYQIHVYARSAFGVKMPIVASYSEASVCVDADYYSRALVVERVQYEFFVQNGLLEDFKAMRQKKNFEEVYLEGLKKVSPSELPACSTVLREIDKLYNSSSNDSL